MTLSIFDIPHLREGIAQYLSTGELAQSVLVCKEWLHWFTPYIWRNVRIVRNTFQNPAFIRNLPHIWSVTIDNKYADSTEVTVLSFPNLKSLTFWRCSALSESTVLFHFLETPNFRLSDLCLIIDGRKHATVERLIQGLESHPTLTRLDLIIRATNDSMLLPRLLHACRRYYSLHLKLFSNSWETDRAMANEVLYKIRDALERMPDMQVRDLSVLLSPQPQLREFITSLLQHCPQLECYKLLAFEHQYVLKQIIDHFKHNISLSPSRLRFNNSDVEREADSAVDMSYSLRDQHNMGNSITEGGDGSLSPKSTQVPVSPQCSMQVFPRNTLTALDLVHASSLSFPLFVNAVCNLSSLTSLKIAVLIGPNVGEAYDTLEFKEALQKPWPFFHLTDIAFKLDTKNDAKKIGTPAWEGSMADQSAGYLFDQIGRQRNLREMELISHQILSLRDSYLLRLSELKQLRGLKIHGANEFFMGDKEAEWMVKNWPRLVHVTALYEGFGLAPEAVQEENFQAFKTSLLARRPWIQVDLDPLFI